MLFAAVVFTAFAAAAAGYDVVDTFSPECQASCNPLKESIEACIKFMKEDDTSQEDTCKKMCEPEMQEEFFTCTKCFQDAEEEEGVGEAMLLIQDQVCVATENQETPDPVTSATNSSDEAETDATSGNNATSSGMSTTSFAMPTTSSHNFTLPTTVTLNGTQTKKNREDNSASTAVIAPAVMLLGLVAAMI